LQLGDPKIWGISPAEPRFTLSQILRATDATWTSFMIRLNAAAAESHALEHYRVAMIDRDEIGRKLQEAARSQRRYAGFFDWPNRAIGEWGIAATFNEAAVGESGLPFQSLELRGAGKDPPDCEVIDAEGRRVAIEVTELVDGIAVAAAQHGDAWAWADWSCQKFLTMLQERLDSKDGKLLQDGPYDQFWVIIHTDEPILSPSNVKQWLAGHKFKPPQQLIRAYLLLSYDPQCGQYPLFRLL
jgi:hypothetical protein